MDALQAQLDDAENRLTRLRASTAGVGSTTARTRLAKLDDEDTVETAREQVRAARMDAGAAATAEERLRGLHAELDDVEDAVQLPDLMRDLQDTIDDCAHHAERSGRPEVRRELADLQHRATIVIRDQDRVAARALLDRAKDFLLDLIRHSPERDIILFQILRGMRDRLRPADRADALIREGETAIAAADRHALAGVNERLRRLIPPDVPDPVGGLI